MPPNCRHWPPAATCSRNWRCRLPWGARASPWRRRFQRFELRRVGATFGLPLLDYANRGAAIELADAEGETAYIAFEQAWPARWRRSNAA